MPQVESISLVVPVYNEQDNIPVLFEEIHGVVQNLGRDWELIFIDDGSTDNSLDVLRGLAAKHPQVRYVSLAQNRGQSAGFSIGFGRAKGQVIITMDADLQNDPADIPAMLELYEQGYDMVIGWRAKRRDTLVKRLASRFANRVRNAISRETVKDTGCSLKIMRTDLARKIPMFTGMHRFLPTLMKLEGAKVAEVKVNHRPRKHGKSKYGIWDRAFSSAYDLFAVRWMQKRHISFKVKETDQDPGQTRSGSDQSPES